MTVDTRQLRVYSSAGSILPRSAPSADTKSCGCFRDTPICALPISWCVSGDPRPSRTLLNDVESGLIPWVVPASQQQAWLLQKGLCTDIAWMFVYIAMYYTN